MDRVIDAPQYRETGELTELSHRDIKYDINGNILSYYMGCDMVNDTHDTLNYSGNQASIFMYDANGNVSHIIAEDISIEYNILNLMSRVTYLTESGMYGTMPILYDFNNRYYNSVNFLNIDPLSEKSYGLSPYSFAANNPFRNLPSCALEASKTHTDPAKILPGDSSCQKQ